ncbi:hypothetical protein O6H91_Y039900 [Diphasiastrum complanatum]|nr:hypothetical protein O6H91_Y039900 [Diphasiastrum complanatum]
MHVLRSAYKIRKGTLFHFVFWIVRTKEKLLEQRILKGIFSFHFCCLNQNFICWKDMAAVSHLTVGHSTSQLSLSRSFTKNRRETLCSLIPGARGFSSLPQRAFFSQKSGARKRTPEVHMVLDTEQVDTQNNNEYLSTLAREFEQRFTPPHVTDIFPIEPIPSTFCVNSSCPLPDRQLLDQAKNLGKIFVHDDDRVLLKVIKYASPTSAGAECIDPDCNFINQWVCRAGPRARIYFSPDEVKAAIVTCGGLCPGLNDVIRQVIKV